MSKNTLLFIPDISGFTKFVKQTEVQHGQHIISELLEILIDSNELGLTLSEIEGDALLFYKQQAIPGKQELVKQAQTMFINFHGHLKKYESHRICECGACRSAGNLTLKIITHLGPIDFIAVKDRSKPYGTDVILAHRLLKNDIDNKEYLLLTQQYLEQGDQKISSEDIPWLRFEQGSIQYDSIGSVNYHYASLSPLHEFVSDPAKVSNPVRIARPIITEAYINRPRDETFETIIDLDQRMQWNRFAKDITHDGKTLNQLGKKHVCVFDSHSIEFETVTNSFESNSLVYGEKILNLPPFAKEITIYFTVGEKGAGSLVRIQVHYSLKPLIGWIVEPFFRYNTGKLNKKVVNHLKEWCESSN